MARNKNGKMTTIKVRDPVRQWLKIQAAQKDVPMYQLVEALFSKAMRGKKPWQSATT